MKKEQILLIVCIVAAAVIAYTNLGLYEPVGAAQIGDGKDVPSSVNAWYDPQTGLPPQTGDGRSVFRQKRVSRRPPLPRIDAPEPLPPIWVRLLTRPAPDPEHWSSLRERYEVVAAAEDTSTEEAGAEEMEDDDEATASDDPFKEKPRVDLALVARIVLKDGTEKPCELIPQGALKGQPTWTILENWPNVEFTVVELNERNGTIIGSYPVGPDEIATTYKTVLLEKTCVKEFHERRIRQNVRNDDPAALRDLAGWVMDTLKPKYGQEAVRLAIETVERAWDLKKDQATVRLLASLYRAAFDLEGEVRVLREFLDAGNSKDPTALELLAEALDRAGAISGARALWVQSAEIGSLTARLGLAENLYDAGELTAALEEFTKVQGSGDAADRAHAYEGEARIHIRQGRFKAALTAADRAVQSSAASWSVLNTQGSARYYNGRYAEAAQAFKSAMTLAPETQSIPRSNLGIALVAQGDLAGADAAFRACIEKDPLNFFDPIVGLADVQQRRGRLTEANDLFETAVTRDPHNAWVLLRLGTAKLADGVTDRALELARSVVEAAPGCVDGLRLAGLANRQLDEPSYGDALRDMSRAFQKEPENIEILRQYATTLLGAGKAEDALRLLEEATAKGTGFARRDGRTLALKAYTYFLLRYPIEIVRQTIGEAQRAEIDDAAAEYVRQMADTINEWDALRIWTDEFKRGGSKLFAGWKENDEHLSIPVTCVGNGEGYAQFKGTARGAAEDRNATSFSRSESAKSIREWEAAIRLMSTDTQVVVHVYSGTLQLPGDDESGGGRRRRGSGAELGFVVTRDDKVVLYTTAGAGRKGQNLNEIPIQDAEGGDVLFPRDGEFHTVKMVRTDHKMGTWQVYLDGAPIGEEQEIGTLADQRGKEIELGFQVDADRGTQIEVHVDRVEILRTVD